MPDPATAPGPQRVRLPRLRADGPVPKDGRTESAAGPDATGWSAEEAALLTAVDELYGDACLSEQTWHALRQRYSETQMMDLVFTIGAYAMLAMALNSFGVRLDAGLKGFSRG